MCVRNVDVHVSCSSQVDAQLAAFFIDPRAKWSTVQGNRFYLTFHRAYKCYVYLCVKHITRFFALVYGSIMSYEKCGKCVFNFWKSELYVFSMCCTAQVWHTGRAFENSCSLYSLCIFEQDLINIYLFQFSGEILWTPLDRSRRRRESDFDAKRFDKETIFALYRSNAAHTKSFRRKYRNLFSSIDEKNVSMTNSS